ncbi:hypothetical protein [Microbulbifer sp. JMSA002]|jgi:hypothetical protein|uniref:hypothetical protein n=1 Tax=Microbulbifer sp. JMSA002 TaxID=3243368 RepID=UPI0040396971
MSILEKFMSGSPDEIWSASCEVAKCKNLELLDSISDDLEVIEQATAGIDLGGGFCPNSYHLKFALKKLRVVRKRGGCLCSLYPEYMFFNPIYEEKACSVTISEVAKIDGKWIDYYMCKCTNCHSLYRVEEREGHFTFWSWKKA